MIALAFLVAYALPIIETSLDPGVLTVLNAVLVFGWVLFLADFVIRVVLADGRRAYVLAHWYDVAIILVPLLRPLRAMRGIFRVLNRSAGGTVFALVTAVFAVLLGALGVLGAERTNADANITNYGDALWWAAVTVTTVGYGEYSPVTLKGRLIAVVLMLVGVGLVGTITGATAAWVLDRSKRQQRRGTESAAPDDDGASLV